MARPSALERVGRILAIVPWIAERDGPRIDEVCERFGVERAELLDDLNVVFVVGLHPYTPDNLTVVDIDDDRVWISYTNFFERPLRLGRDEALGILAAGKVAAQQLGHDPDGPLARGLAKLATVLDVDLDDDLDVVLGGPGDETLAGLREAVAAHRVLELGYFSHARNAHSERRVEPLRLFHTEGQWYLGAWCRSSDGFRLFRADRITDLRATDESFTPRADPWGDDPATFAADDHLPRVTIEVDADGAWAAEQGHVEDVEELPDGGRRFTIAVSATPWLERLLLRLGPHGRVVAGDPELRAAGRDAARRLLARGA